MSDAGGAPSEDAAVTEAGLDPPPFREVQQCGRTDYQDRRASDAERLVRWTHGLGPERCLMVRAGQTVIFQGDLSYHPLDPVEPIAGNPVASHDRGLVVFPTPGLFGFVCGSHPTMLGAVWVWP